MAAKSRKKGLAMGFTSRQKESLNTSSNQLNSRLAMLQQGQEELLKEKQELESLRQQLKDQAPVKNTATLLPVNTLKLSGETQSRKNVHRRDDILGRGRLSPHQRCAGAWHRAFPVRHS